VPKSKIVHKGVKIAKQFIFTPLYLPSRGEYLPPWEEGSRRMKFNQKVT
jgi:hypothetical protein